MKTVKLLAIVGIACLASFGCHKDAKMASPGMTGAKSDCCSGGTCTDKDAKDAKKANMGAVGDAKASGCCSEAKKTN